MSIADVLEGRERWCVINADCLGEMAAMVERGERVDHVITDPPYEEQAHTKQRRVKNGERTSRWGGTTVDPLNPALSFEPISDEQRGSAGRQFAQLARRWVIAFCQVEAARTEVADAIAEHWEHHLGPISQMMYDRLPKLAREFSIEDLAAAMAITARKMGREREFRPAKAHEHAWYFQGILRRWRTEGVQR